MRITAQSIDATNDRHPWSETCDCGITDIVAIQDEIVNAMVAAGFVRSRAEGFTGPLDRIPASFRNFPGFKCTHRTLRVLAYWRAHGFPPQCRAVGKTDFTCD